VLFAQNAKLDQARPTKIGPTTGLGIKHGCKITNLVPRVSLQGTIYRGCSSLPWLQEGNPTGQLFGDNLWSHFDTFWILALKMKWLHVWDSAAQQSRKAKRTDRGVAAHWSHPNLSLLCLEALPSQTSLCWVAQILRGWAWVYSGLHIFWGTGNCDLKGLACCYKIHFCWFDFLSQVTSTWNPIGGFSPVAFSIRSDSLQSVVNIPTFFGGYPVTLL
jgi:hypothetical protein